MFTVEQGGYKEEDGSELGFVVEEGGYLDNSNTFTIESEPEAKVEKAPAEIIAEARSLYEDYYADMSDEEVLADVQMQASPEFQQKQEAQKAENDTYGDDSTRVVSAYNVDGTYNPKSPYWKGMTGPQMDRQRQSDRNSGLIPEEGAEGVPTKLELTQLENVRKKVAKDPKFKNRSVSEINKETLLRYAEEKGENSVTALSWMTGPAKLGVMALAKWGGMEGALTELVGELSRSNAELVGANPEYAKHLPGGDTEEGRVSNLDTKTNLLESAINVAEGGAVGGVAGGLFGLVAKPIQKIYQAVSGSKPITKEVAELAEDYGIKLTPGQKVDSKTVKHVEDLLSDGFGGKSIINTREAQVETVEKLVKSKAGDAESSFAVHHAEEIHPQSKKALEAIEEAKKGGDIDEIRAAEASYKNLTDDLISQAKHSDGHYTSKAINDEILEAVPRALEDKRVNLSDAYEKALKGLDDDVIRTYGQKVDIPTPKSTKGMKEVLEEESRLGPLSRGVEKPVKGIADFEPKSFKDMDLMKRSLSDKSKTAFNKGDHAASKKFSGLSDAVKSDMDDFAKTVGGKTDAYKALDKGWSDYSELKNSPLMKSITRKEFGEDVWNTLSSGAAKDSKVEKFVHLINESKNPEGVRKAMYAKFNQDAMKASYSSGDFSVHNYLKFLKENNNALRHINAKSHVTNKGLIRVLEKVAEGQKSTAKMANQNNLLGIMSRFGPAVLGGVSGYESGGAEGALKGMAAGASARYLGTVALKALTSLMKSPDLLTKFLNKPSIQKMLAKLPSLKSEAAEELCDKILKALIVGAEEVVGFVAE